MVDEFSDPSNADPESSLRASWSIGPLRPWLIRIAQRELPAELRGKIDPSDVVQQTLLDAWRGESGFRGSSHSQRLAWLRVILRRVVLQHRRRLLQTAKRGAGAERAVTDAMADTSVRIEELAIGKEPAPDEVVGNAEQSLLVAAAIEKLPEDYRHVIELRHFHGHSHASVAAELGRSAAATRMLWVRALVELRRIVKQ
jgi:RNA polymerase sigma-70 factor (ECF subfamily)